MWTPTHVQVTVQQARKLIRKGKNDTNDAYVMISLGKEKYQTSIRERSKDPEWHEECDLPIPDMSAVVHLNTYHRNLLGIDEFLGHVDIPLEQFHIYERPRNRWYVLKNKPGSKKAEKYRGEIEVKVMFMVHSLSGSQSRLDKTSKVKKSSSFKTIASAMGEKFKWSSRGSLTLNRTSGEAHSSFGETVSYQQKDFLPTSYNNYESVDSSSHVSSLEVEDTPETPQSDTSSRNLSKHSKKRRLNKISLLSQSSLPPPTSQNVFDEVDSSQDPVLLRRRWADSSPRQNSLTGYFESSETGDIDPLSKRHSCYIVPTHEEREEEKESISEGPVSSEAEEEDGEKDEKLDMEETIFPLDAGDNSESKSPDNKAVLSDAEPMRRVRGSSHQKSASDCSSVMSRSDTRSSVTSHSSTSASSHRTTADESNGITPPVSDISRSSCEVTPPKTPSENSSTKNTNGVTPSDNSVADSTGDIEPEEDLALNEKVRKLKDSSGRHTLQSGSSTPRRSAHELYESIYEYKKAQEEKASLGRRGSLAPETISLYQNHSREDLIRLVTEQRLQVHDKDLYIKDLENYIDNLLVRVIESTPGVLQNPPSPLKPRQSSSSTKVNQTPLAMPNNQSAWLIQTNQSGRNSPNNQSQYSTPANQVKGVGYSSAQSQVSIMNTNNSNNTQKKSPFKNLHIENPFAKIQAAFK